MNVTIMNNSCVVCVWVGIGTSLNEGKRIVILKSWIWFWNKIYSDFNNEYNAVLGLKAFFFYDIVGKNACSVYFPILAFLIADSYKTSPPKLIS